MKWSLHRRMILIVLTALFLNLNCASQNPKSALMEEYNVINAYIKKYSITDLKKNTTTDFVNTNDLESLNSWNDANDNLSNINRDKLDFRDLFEADEFKVHIDNFLAVESKKLKAKRISNTTNITNTSKTSISLPYTFTSKINNKRYSFMYVEIVNGPENGSGSICLFQKISEKWVLIFERELWIS